MTFDSETRTQKIPYGNDRNSNNKGDKGGNRGIIGGGDYMDGNHGNEDDCVTRGSVGEIKGRVHDNISTRKNVTIKEISGEKRRVDRSKEEEVEEEDDNDDDNDDDDDDDDDDGGEESSLLNMPHFSLQSYSNSCSYSHSSRYQWSCSIDSTSCAPDIVAKKTKLTEVTSTRFHPTTGAESDDSRSVPKIMTKIASLTTNDLVDLRNRAIDTARNVDKKGTLNGGRFTSALLSLAVHARLKHAGGSVDNKDGNANSNHNATPRLLKNTVVKF